MTFELPVRPQQGQMGNIREVCAIFSQFPILSSFLQLFQRFTRNRVVRAVARKGPKGWPQGGMLYYLRRHGDWQRGKGAAAMKLLPLLARICYTCNAAGCREVMLFSTSWCRSVVVYEMRCGHLRL